jgi:hypothetical protein
VCFSKWIFLYFFISIFVKHLPKETTNMPHNILKEPTNMSMSRTQCYAKI